jgi:hypothetical protein
MCLGFLGPRLFLPDGGPVPKDWPPAADLLTMLQRAGEQWDKLGLQPPSDSGVLLPPGYPREGGETIEGAVERLARDWRKKLDRPFESQAAPADSADEDVKQVLETGISGANALPLRLQVLLLAPNQYFKLHAHATFELQLTLRGSLGEIRLVSKDRTKPLHLPFRGPFAEREQGQLEGPDLAALPDSHDSLLKCSQWQERTSIVAGEWLANEIGSMHQSFSTEDHFAGLVLWGGKHANISSVKAWSKVMGSELLHESGM